MLTDIVITENGIKIRKFHELISNLRAVNDYLNIDGLDISLTSLLSDPVTSAPFFDIKINLNKLTAILNKSRMAYSSANWSLVVKVIVDSGFKVDVGNEIFDIQFIPTEVTNGATNKPNTRSILPDDNERKRRQLLDTFISYFEQKEKPFNLGYTIFGDKECVGYYIFNPTNNKAGTITVDIMEHTVVHYGLQGGDFNELNGPKHDCPRMGFVKSTDPLLIATWFIEWICMDKV